MDKNKCPKMKSQKTFVFFKMNLINKLKCGLKDWGISGINLGKF